MRFRVLLIGVALLVPAAAARAGETPRPGGGWTPLPGGVGGVATIPRSDGNPGGGGGGGGGGGVCPGFRMGPIESYVGGGDDGNAPIYAVSSYWCDGSDTPIRVFTCIANCPPGVAVYIPPPSTQEVRERFLSLAIRPDPRWAPPLHDSEAFALVGKYLYFAVTPETHRVVTDTITFPGGWYATGSVTPGRITMRLTGHDPVTCDGPGPDPATAAGRALADRVGCVVLVDRAPDSGRGTVSVSTTWTVTVDSNIAGIAGTSWTLETTAARDIDIKQLQAINVG